MKQVQGSEVGSANAFLCGSGFKISSSIRLASQAARPGAEKNHALAWLNGCWHWMFVFLFDVGRSMFIFQDNFALIGSEMMPDVWRI